MGSRTPRSTVHTVHIIQYLIHTYSDSGGMKYRDGPVTMVKALIRSRRRFNSWVCRWRAFGGRLADGTRLRSAGFPTFTVSIAMLENKTKRQMVF